MARTLAVAAVIGATAVVLLTRGGVPGDDRLAVSDDSDATLPPLAGDADDERRVDATETPAAAKIRELNLLSETYRNTTFLIAIRDSGFLCRELLGVYGGVNDSGTWTVNCSQMLAYTVRVATSGALRIEPMLQHVDGIGPQPQLELRKAPVLPPQ